MLCHLQTQTPSGSPAYGCVSYTDPFRVTSLWLCQLHRPLQGHQLMVVSVLCQVQTQTAASRWNENSVSLLSAYLGSALQGLGFTQSKHFRDFGTYLLMGVRWCVCIVLATARILFLALSSFVTPCLNIQKCDALVFISTSLMFDSSRMSTDEEMEKEREDATTYAAHHVPLHRLWLLLPADIISLHEGVFCGGVFVCCFLTLDAWFHF